MQSESDTEEPGPAAAPIILGAIVALAAVLDLYCLGCAPLTQNESISYAVVVARGGDFMHLAVRDKPEMALYYLVLRGLVGVGTSAFALRMLSVIFAVASIPVLYALAVKLFGVRTALVATALLAVNTSFTLQAQNARSYSMSAFFVLVATWILVDNIAKQSRFKSILYVLAMTAAIYSHTLSILILPAHWMWIRIADSSRSAQMRFAKEIVGLAILLVPGAWLIVRGEPDQFDWIPSLSGLSFKDVFSGFAGAPYGPSNGLRRTFMAVFAVALTFGFLGLVQAISGRRADFAAWVMAAAGFLIPTFLLIVISIVYPLYQFRYLVMALPFFTLFAAAGLCATEYRVVSSLIFSAIVVLSIALQASIHRLPNTYPYPSLTRSLLEKAQPGDSLIMIPAFLRFPIDYYADRLSARGQLPSIAYPRWDSRLRVDGQYVEGALMRGDNLSLKQAFQNDYSRLWIVLPARGTPTSARELQSLSVRYKCHSTEDFAELELIRFDNCGAAAPTH